MLVLASLGAVGAVYDGECSAGYYPQSAQWLRTAMSCLRSLVGSSRICFQRHRITGGTQSESLKSTGGASFDS